MVTSEKVMRTATLIKYSGTERLGIKITFPYNTKDLLNVKSLDGRKYNNTATEKYWTAPLSLETVRKLKKWEFQLCPNLTEYCVEKDSLQQVSEFSGQLNIKGLKGKLFPFQAKGVQFIEQRDGRALIGDEMGLGKTVQALGWLQLQSKKRPVIIVVPASLKLNWEKEANKWLTEPNVQVLSGKDTNVTLYGEIIVINYDILVAWLERLQELQAKVLVLDECFPTGTLISTPKGDKKIEELKEGDEVYNATGIGIIQNVNKRLTKELIRLHLTDDTFIDVTPNHPFFTENGWVEAKNLKDEKLFGSSDIFNIFALNIKSKTNDKKREKLQMVWESFFSKNKNTNNVLSFVFLKIRKQFTSNIKSNTCKEKVFSLSKRISTNLSTSIQRKTFLREILFSEMENATTRGKENSLFRKNCKKDKFRAKTFLQRKPRKGKTNIQQNERKQSFIQSRNDEQNKILLGGIWASINQTAFERRQWKTFTKSTKNFMGCIRTRMENRISNCYKTIKRIRVSYMLQSRYCPTKIQNLDRGRWVVTWFKREKRTRQKENTTSTDIRVEWIEILKRESGNQFRGSAVYNLQVSNHPSYYAGGVLVHNCHYIKSNAAQRTKAVKKLAKSIPHIIALSGTPIINRPIEFYNIINIIDNTIVSNFWTYVNRYCKAKKNGFGWDFSGASNTDELHKKLTESIMLRRMKKDVLQDLPDKIYSFVPIPLINRNEYNEAENNFIGYLRKTRGAEAADRASGAETLVQVEMLKQIAVAGKMEGVIDWIEEFLQSGEKLVVMATHRIVLETLESVFKKISVRLDGSTSAERRQQVVDDFQNKDSIRLFLGNIKAAGVGITLTAASNVAFIELPYTPAELQQAEDRCHRIGQKNAVNIYYLLSENTIESKIAMLLDSKKQVLDAVLDGKITKQESLLQELFNSYA